MKITKNQGSQKHTFWNMTDQDLADLYHHLPDGNKLRDKIYHHLIDCVTDEDLEDTGALSAKEYIDNWLTPRQQLAKN
jgi:hypothetical protein